MSNAINGRIVHRICLNYSFQKLTLNFFYSMNSYEVKRREADVKRQRHLEDEKRKAKEFDDHQRRESEKVKQREDGTYYFIHANFDQLIHRNCFYLIYVFVSLASSKKIFVM